MNSPGYILIRNYLLFFPQKQNRTIIATIINIPLPPKPREKKGNGQHG